MRDELGAVLAGFGVEDAIVEAVRLAGGHIHGTWRITTAGGERFVAQALNDRVFPDLDACERNLRRIDDHLRDNPAIGVPRFRRSRGLVHWVGASGTTWRLTEFAEGTIGGSACRDAMQAYEAASAFGRYVRALATLPLPPLAVTIPHFHDLAKRVAQLDAAIDADSAGRVSGAAGDIASARCLIDTVGRSRTLVAALPVRHVHNDAKVANLRFDEATGRAVFVVDLDTTMPGTLLFDVGELLRTASTASAEDDPDGQSVDDARIAAVVRGFLDGAGPLVTTAERAGFSLAGPLMALENAVRFLADHLNGDRYFAIERDGHNIDRARAQLSVCALLLDSADLVDRACAG